MKSHCVAWAATLAIIVLPFSLSAAENVSLAAVDGWATEFSGREVVRRYRVEANAAWEGRLVWSLSANQRTLARGEQPIRVPAGSATDAAIKLRLDPLREGVVLSAELDVAIVHKETEVARKRLRLSFFSEDPFTSRSQWLRSLKIVLFDPDGKTADVLDQCKIPYTITRNLDHVRRMEAGVLIIGAATSLDAHRGLADAILAAASQGTRVLCLKLTDGALPLTAFANAKQFSFQNESIVRQLDERLDIRPWPPSDSLVSSRLRFAVENREVVAKAGESGWPWLETTWPERGGRFIYCGFPIMEHWDVNPTPRYMLLRILERLTTAED